MGAVVDDVRFPPFAGMTRIRFSGSPLQLRGLSVPVAGPPGEQGVRIEGESGGRNGAGPGGVPQSDARIMLRTIG